MHKFYGCFSTLSLHSDSVLHMLYFFNLPKFPKTALIWNLSKERFLKVFKFGFQIKREYRTECKILSWNNPIDIIKEKNAMILIS